MYFHVKYRPTQIKNVIGTFLLKQIILFVSSKTNNIKSLVLLELIIMLFRGIR